MIDPTVVLEYLDNEDDSLVNYAMGYAARVARRDARFPFDHLEHFSRRPLAQARLLQVVVDLPEAWTKAQELGTEIDQAYWKEFSIYGRGSFTLVDESSRALLDHGRHVSALQLMLIYMTGDRQRPNPQLVLEALKVLGSNDVEQLHSYEIETLIEYLRQSNIDEDEITRLEWRFLSALGFEPKGLVLERKLAREPAFFVEVLSLCYRAKDTKKTSVVPQHVAANAYRLLRSWEIIPGATDRGATSSLDALKNWYSTAEPLLIEADRLDIGQQVIGQVLAYSPADEDGLWPCETVRLFIEHIASDRIETGFQTACFNKRGVVSRSLDEGGKQEYELADKYTDWAERIATSASRTAAILRTVAAGYMADARREDEEARQRLEGLDD